MRETHVAAGRCAGALVLSLGVLAPAAAPHPAPRWRRRRVRRHAKVSKVSCVRRCASQLARPGRQHAQADRLRARLGRQGRLQWQLRHAATTSPCRCARARDAALSVRVPVGAVSGPVTVITSAKAQVAADGAGRDPAAPAARAEPGAQPGPGRAAPARPERRDRHQPYPRLCRARAARSPSPSASRARSPTPPTVELVRASDGATVKSWDPGAVPSGEVQTHRLGRPARPRRRQAGPLLVPADRGERRRRAGAQRPGRRRRARLLRPLRQHLPDPRPPQLRRRGGPLRRRARRPQPPGPGRLRQVRDAAGRRPRRASQVQAVPRGGRQLRRDRRGGHRASTTSTCTSPSRPRSGPATASTRASASARSATPATPTAATSTSSSGPAPGWYDGGKAVRPAALAEGLGRLVLAAGTRAAPLP